MITATFPAAVLDARRDPPSRDRPSDDAASRFSAKSLRGLPEVAPASDGNHDEAVT
jgi:hypothetical protein